jgi:hypothetical protein
MKVFISWSGKRSQTVALALREWLPNVIQSVKPWVSQADIEAGARWLQEIDHELNDTRFGIICLTRDNQLAPWILFEAGALAKTIEKTFVCPYLIEMEPRDIEPGPLTQFQAKRATRDETKELVLSINNALPDGRLSENRVTEAVELWWPKLEQALNALPADPQPEEPPRQLEDMVEEMLGLVRDLARRSPTRSSRTSYRTASEAMRAQKSLLSVDSVAAGEQRISRALVQDMRDGIIIELTYNHGDGLLTVDRQIVLQIRPIAEQEDEAALIVPIPGTEEERVYHVSLAVLAQLFARPTQVDGIPNTG